MPGQSTIPSNKSPSLLGKRRKQFIREFHSTLKTTDAEHLHDLRVATRRLLALLRVGRRTQKSKEINRLILDLRKLMKPLGRQRDFLLQVERLQQDNAFKNSGLAAYYEDLNRRLKKQQRIVETVLHQFDVKEFSKRLDKQETGLVIEKNTANSKIWRNYLSGELHWIKKWKREVFQKLDTARFHKMRIRLKKLRYFLEIVQGTLPGLPPHGLKTLITLQTWMGDIHDIDILADDLLVFSRTLYPGSKGLVALAQFVETLQETRWMKFERVRQDFEAFEKQFILDRINSRNT